MALPPFPPESPRSAPFHAAEVARDAAALLILLATAAGRGADAAMRAIAAAAARHFAGYGLVTRARVAEFIGQVAHETGGFARFEEDLRYSAARLAEVWPGRFAIDPRAPAKQPNAAAHALAGRPEALAEQVYARPEEGNVRPGDGWRYRGRGLLQLTFRNNYLAAGLRLGLDLVGNPDLAADPATSVPIALDFWARAGVNACCDRADWRGARGLTNCGTATPKVAPVGLEDVARRRARVLALLIF